MCLANCALSECKQKIKVADSIIDGITFEELIRQDEEVPFPDVAEGLCENQRGSQTLYGVVMISRLLKI